MISDTGRTIFVETPPESVSERYQGSVEKTQPSCQDELLGDLYGQRLVRYCTEDPLAKQRRRSHEERW